MVLIFLVTKVFQKRTMFKWVYVLLSPVFSPDDEIAVSLLSNRMLVMWKIQHAKQDDAEFIWRINPPSEPGHRAEVFMRKTLQPAYRDPGWKNRNLGNRASSSSDEHIRGKARYRKPGSYEEAFNYPYLLAFAYLFKLLTQDFIILWGALHVVIRLSCEKLPI